MKRRDLIRMTDEEVRAFLEEGERYDELRGVQIKGHGVINDDPTVVQRVGEEIWKRYTGPLDESARQAVAIQGAKRVAIFVKPSEVVSWDHRKLGGTY